MATDKLRFDYSCLVTPTDDELFKIQNGVQLLINSNEQIYIKNVRVVLIT